MQFYLSALSSSSRPVLLFSCCVSDSQGNATGDAERYMAMAKETIEQLKSCAVDLRQLGQPNDNIVRT